MSVVIRGVDVTNNVEEKRSVVVETILKPLLSKQNSVTRGDMFDDATASFENIENSLNRIANRKLLDFRDKKLPHSLIMFAQVCIFHPLYFLTHIILIRIPYEILCHCDRFK